MNKKKITGIQQVGIGVSDVAEAWAWYRKHLGMDIGVFEDVATAELMLPYTDGKTCDRHAVLAYNMQSGGGFEVWRHTGKTPEAASFEIEFGDLGILATKMKSTNPANAFNKMQSEGVNILGNIEVSPEAKEHFFLKDPYDNIFEISKDEYVFEKTAAANGGVLGVIIGVSDIEQSLKLYRDLLGYDTVVYDETGVFPDFVGLPGGDRKFRRVLLKHAEKRTGGFAPLFGPTQIELIQWVEGTGRKIYKDRIWGDLGYIHICFDVIGMDLLKEEAKQKGFPFTVDSANSFDMGEAAGRFAYLSDPDDLPIEFVETHKVPIIKKLNWYINLTKRDPNKSLPRWMIKTLNWKRVKN